MFRKRTKLDLIYPKQFVKLNDYPVIYYLINTLLNCNFKTIIYLVILEEYKEKNSKYN